MKKEEIYKRVKIWGIISFIPMMLAAGPLAGFLAGDYLKKRFGLDFVLYICISIGIIASILEVIRVIRVVIKIAK